VRAVVACVLVLAIAGCTRSLADATCPCVAGWTCCVPRNVCLPDGALCEGAGGGAGGGGPNDSGAPTGDDGPAGGGGRIIVVGPSDGGDPALADSSGPTGGSDAPLEPYSCATMARYVAPAQLVDGMGGEFDGITPVVFRASEAPWTDVVPPPDLPETVTFRAAWSRDGFHIHVHVDDPTVIVNPDASKLWDGDSVEVMVANSTTFTGRFDGSNDGGAIHVGVSPPSGYYDARGVIYVDPVNATYRYQLPADWFAARQVPGGYEVEIYLPWAPTTTPPVPGGSIGFQFAINVQDVPTSAGAQYGRQLTANLPMRAVDPPPGCGLVWCDDRTWCRPTLE